MINDLYERENHSIVLKLYIHLILILSNGGQICGWVLNDCIKEEAY